MPHQHLGSLVIVHYRKVLFIELVRAISGQQFLDGLEESLLPRLQGACVHELAQLKAVLAKHSMVKGSIFLVSTDGAKPNSLLTGSYKARTHHTQSLTSGYTSRCWCWCPFLTKISKLWHPHLMAHQWLHSTIAYKMRCLTNSCARSISHQVKFQRYHCGCLSE